MANFTRADEHVWRALAQAANDRTATAQTLNACVRATAGRAMPCTGRRDQSAFVALQALARAAAEGPRARRMRLASCMVDLAMECAELAGWTLDGSERTELQQTSPVNGKLFQASIAA